MDTTGWNAELDRKLAATGVVDEETFSAFAHAWVYDGATPIA